MSTRSIARALLLGAVFGLVGCDKPQEKTETPEPEPGEPAAQTTPDAQPDASEPAAPQEQALPRVQDRDPEEERRKMSLSRDRSAQAEKLLVSGQLKQAVDQSRAALRIHEQNVHAMLVMGEAYFKMGKYELTQTVTSSAVVVDPKVQDPTELSQAYNLKGFAYLAMGKPNSATEAFKKAAETDANNAAAWNNLGTRYLEGGDFKTATSCFEYVVKIDPTFAKGHLNLGAALRAQRRWTEAEKAFNDALARKSNYAEAYFNLGVLYLDADPYPGVPTEARLKKAIAYLTKYRDLAAKGKAQAQTVSVSKAAQQGPTRTESVGVAAADDYMAVAKKALDREKRRQEREAKRAQKGGGDAQGEGTEASDGAADGTGEAGAEGGAAPEAAPPTGTAGESGPKPQQPGVQKPGVVWAPVRRRWIRDRASTWREVRPVPGEQIDLTRT